MSHLKKKAKTSVSACASSSGTLTKKEGGIQLMTTHAESQSVLACVHFIHAVQEVVRGPRDAVAAHAEAAVCALISRVIGATVKIVKTQQDPINLAKVNTC